MNLNMSFLIKDYELLKKYNKIWENVKNILQKESDSEPVYSEKYLQAKIKSCNRKINTNFYDNEIPKEGSKFICLSVILIDSVFRTSKNYYPQVFLEECQYVFKGKEIPKYIIDDIETFVILKILMKKILIKKILMKKTLIK